MCIIELELPLYYDPVQCPISEEDFIMEYSAIIEDMEIMDPQTKQSCSLAVEASHEGR